MQSSTNELQILMIAKMIGTPWTSQQASPIDSVMVYVGREQLLSQNGNAVWIEIAAAVVPQWMVCAQMHRAWAQRPYKLE
jgi:hypothetical protein